MKLSPVKSHRIFLLTAGVFSFLIFSAFVVDFANKRRFPVISIQLDMNEKTLSESRITDKSMLSSHPEDTARQL
jgi:hypothetical protein